MDTASQLELLRPLGKLEQIAASCHHLGFFNNVGLSASYKLLTASPWKVSNLRGLIYAAVGDVARQHRILFAIPVNEDTPSPEFALLPSIDLNKTILFLERSKPLAVASGEDAELDATLQDQHNIDFKSDYGTRPSWRLIILQSPEVETEFTASFIYHHAIGDGMAGLAFHNAFRVALDAASSSSTPPNQAKTTTIMPDETIQLLPSLEELHELPINPSPPQPPPVKLNGWTGNPIRLPCKSGWASLYLSPSTSRRFVQECKEKGQSVTSALSSVIAAVLFRNLAPTVESLTCIVPVNLRPWLNLPPNAIGTYFDATTVHFTRPDGYIGQDILSADEIWAGASQASKAINDYLSNVSPTGQPYTSVAHFKSIPDIGAAFTSLLGNPRDAAFEVTNVGVVRSATISKSGEGASGWQVDRVLLSRSAAVSGAAITVSVATGGPDSESGVMALGFSWQEGVVDDSFADGVRMGVKKFFDIYG